MARHNPDDLILNKRQLMMLIDEFIKELGENKKDNWQYILEAYAVKKIFSSIPENKFAWFWGRFWEKAEKFRYVNTAIQDPILQKLTLMNSKDDATKKIISELDFSIEKVLARRG